MVRIFINLLPPEFITEEAKRAKFYKIQFIGVAVILTMTFLTSLTLALRILQSQSIRQVQANLEDTRLRVSDLKSAQASLVLLKDRLAAINRHLGVESKQSAMYKLIDRLIPQSVSVNAITVDKSGEVTFVASVPDYQTLDFLLAGLTNQENQEKIKEISIDSLNRARDGSFRASFKIIPR